MRSLRLIVSVHFRKVKEKGKEIPILSNDRIAQHIDLLAPTLDDTTLLRLRLGQRRPVLLSLANVRHFVDLLERSLL